MGNMKMSRKLLIFFGLLVYLAAILYAKFLRTSIENPTYNWIPFAIEYTPAAVSSLLVNAAVFIPYGILAALVKRNAGWFFIAGFAAVFAIEVLQPVFCTGIFDATTVVVDMAGMTLGYFVYRLFAGMSKKNKDKKEQAA